MYGVQFVPKYKTFMNKKSYFVQQYSNKSPELRQNYC